MCLLHKMCYRCFAVFCLKVVPMVSLLQLGRWNREKWLLCIKCYDQFFLYMGNMSVQWSARSWLLILFRMSQMIFIKKEVSYEKQADILLLFGIIIGSFVKGHITSKQIPDDASTYFLNNYGFKIFLLSVHVWKLLAPFLVCCKISYFPAFCVMCTGMHGNMIFLSEACNHV